MSQQPPYGQQPNQQVPQFQSPTFYNQPTQASPGQFSYPPQNNFPPPKKRTGLWGWYQARTRNMKIGLGCGTIIAILLFFSCIGTAVGSNNFAATLTPTPTAGQAAVILSPTATTIPSPTPIPTQNPLRHQSHNQPLLLLMQCSQHNRQPDQRKYHLLRSLLLLPVKPSTTIPGAIPLRQENSSTYRQQAFVGTLLVSPSDDPGDGYIVQCSDGSFSQSGGERGACSYHGGVSRPLYSH